MNSYFFSTKSKNVFLGIDKSTYKLDQEGLQLHQAMMFGKNLPNKSFLNISKATLTHQIFFFNFDILSSIFLNFFGAFHVLLSCFLHNQLGNITNYFGKKTLCLYTTNLLLFSFFTFCAFWIGPLFSFNSFYMSQNN